jgi:alpha,alpha-trehalase
MRKTHLLRFTCILLWLVGAAHAASVPPTPADVYGELFVRTQLESVYPDSKTFVDALPVRAPEEVMAEYREASKRPGFDLRKFVTERFTTVVPAPTEYHTVPGQDVREHIDRLWSVLERKPDDQRPHSSRLPLPGNYIVPGGRFNEIYYWDSYFTMVGLEESGRHDLTVAMVKNFAFLIDRYGHIPNGNRSYYLSRSQRRRMATASIANTCRSSSASMSSGWRAHRRWRPVRPIAASCVSRTARC